MKLLVFFALCLVALASAYPSDDYSRYENFDIKELVDNVRFLKGYCNCFLDKGKCTPEQLDFKGWIGDALQSKCGKCSEHQKYLVGQVIAAIQTKLPEDWTELNKKYNSEAKYDDEIKEFVEKYGKPE